jgi:hypothetical protein
VTACHGPRLPRRDDGLRAVAWLPRSWWGSLVSEGIFHLQLMRAGRAIRRARLRPINPMEEERGVFTFAFSTRRSCLLHSSPRASLAIAPLSSWSSSYSLFFAPSPARMAPQPPLIIIDTLAWEHSTVTRLALNQLVTGGQLAANEDGRRPHGSCCRKGTERPTLRAATWSASFASMSGASWRRRAVP